MAASNRERSLLIEVLIREASDIDLLCYLARAEGPGVVQELLQCIADAHTLSHEDLRHNLQIVTRKKAEAATHAVRWPTPHQPDHRPAPRSRMVNGSGSVN